MYLTRHIKTAVSDNLPDKTQITGNSLTQNLSTKTNNLSTRQLKTCQLRTNNLSTRALVQSSTSHPTRRLTNFYREIVSPFPLFYILLLRRRFLAHFSLKA